MDCVSFADSFGATTNTTSACRCSKNSTEQFLREFRGRSSKQLAATVPRRKVKAEELLISSFVVSKFTRILGHAEGVKGVVVGSSFHFLVRDHR